MAAVGRETQAVNRLDNELFFDNSKGKVGPRTEIRPGTVPDTLSFFNAPLQTSPAENVPKDNIDLVEASNNGFTSVVDSSGAKSIGGVIREICRDTIRIECVLPSGVVELQLPPTLVPEALMQVGQPISISLDTTGGYRRPVLRARPIGPQPTLPGQDDFEKWADSL